jgi:hypothetical protein
MRGPNLDSQLALRTTTLPNSAGNVTVPRVGDLEAAALLLTVRVGMVAQSRSTRQADRFPRTRSRSDENSRPRTRSQTSRTATTVTMKNKGCSSKDM